ncbi:TPA: hypothetical protein DIC40_06570 [Patescibacteria group bacterium]|nr:hypothetical protein [Candidatus Gracilibacteria bacterium]
MIESAEKLLATKIPFTVCGLVHVLFELSLNEIVQFWTINIPLTEISPLISRFASFIIRVKGFVIFVEFSIVIVVQLPFPYKI